ncbi:MAG: DUF3592 domain-containing protein [Candidatus Kapabacteria bacterium]|nr:DUF3592 domain-containing protein [Candidatus Kapabacteria bacterium]
MGTPASLFRKTNSDRWILIFPLIGILALGFGVWFAYRSYIFTTTMPVYPAVVVGFVPQKTRSFYPVYELRLESGETIRAQSPIGERPPSNMIGDSVTVYYDRSDNSAQADSWVIFWLVPAILCSVGILFTGIGTLFLVMFR